MNASLGNVAILCVGGGAAGFIGASYLSAVHELGIEYHQVYGTSVGALNGALFHQRDLDGLKNIWMNIRNKDVFISNLITNSGILDTRASIYDASPLEKLINRVVDEIKLLFQSETLYCAVTDIESERGMLINLSKIKGPSRPWLIASATPPVFFSPYRIADKYYYDGGLGENINIANAVKNKADTIIVLCPRGKLKSTRISNGFDALRFVTRRQSSYMLEKEIGFVDVMSKVPGTRH